MLRFKADVRIGRWNGHLSEMLDVVAGWSLVAKLDVQVNSIADPAPGRVPTSLHPFDLAIDIEPVGNIQIDRQALAEYCRRHLPANYDIVFESSHVHLEFDMHRGPLTEIAG